MSSATMVFRVNAKTLRTFRKRCKDYDVSSAQLLRSFVHMWGSFGVPGFVVIPADVLPLLLEAIGTHLVNVKQGDSDPLDTTDEADDDGSEGPAVSLDDRIGLLLGMLTFSPNVLGAK